MACENGSGEFYINDKLISKLFIDDKPISTLYINDICVWSEGDTATGTLIFDVPGNYTWVIPDGVTRIELGIVGGGGSGCATNLGGTTEDTWNGGGGNAANHYYRVIDVTPGDSVSLTIGLGGSGVTSPSDKGYTKGNNGGNSKYTDSVNNIDVTGGVGGACDSDTDNIFRGNGEEVHSSKCDDPNGFITYNGNSLSLNSWGGEASASANGTDSGDDSTNSQDAEYGAGSGGVINTNGVCSTGKGGDGFAVIRYGNDITC